MGTLSGDGYYQELDEARADWGLDRDGINLDAPKQKVRQRIEATTRHEKYDEIEKQLIAEGLRIGSKKYRRRFCKLRHRFHDERAASFPADKLEWEKSGPPKTEVFVKCKNCGGGFVAKKADRKRGWAKYCSKSCKAQAQ